MATQDPWTDRLRELPVAVVSDVLDARGQRDQVMAPHIRPLAETDTIAGRAHTVEVIEVDGPPPREQSYAKEIEAVDTIEPGHVLVASTAPAALWGELLSTAAQFKGAAGIVGDTYTRDAAGIRELGFPAFFAGVHPADSLGRIDVRSIGGEITCADVQVREGDYVLADADGVVVIPAADVDQVVAAAERKAGQEGDVRAELAAGRTVREVFDLFGIL